MIEKVVIEITGDTKKIDSTINQLEKLGKVDRKNAEEFEKNNKKHQEALKKTAEHTNSLSEQFNELGKRIAGAFAVEKVIEFLGESIKLAEEAQKTYAQLGFAVTKVNGESTKAFKELVEQSERLSASLDTLYTPDTIKKAQTMLANAKFSSEKIQQLMPRILDIAATTGKSVDEITQKMILTLNSGRNGLKEFGVRFKTTGDVAQDFNNILKSTATFAGGAKNALHTLSGEAQSMSNKVEELQQRLGAKLAPVLEKTKAQLLEYGSSLLDLVNDMLSFNLNSDTFIHYLNVMGMGMFHLADSTERAAAMMKQLNKVKDLMAQTSTIDLLKQEQDLLVKINGSVGEQHERYMELFKALHEELVKRQKEEEEANQKSGESAIDLHKLSMAQLEARKQAIQDAMDQNELFEGKNAIGEAKMIKEIEKEIAARNKLGEKAQDVYRKVLEAREKLVESMKDLDKKEADDYRKIVEGQKSPIEKENEQYKESMRILNDMLLKKLITQEDYDKVSEKEEQRHQDELTKIQKDAEEKRIGDANKQRQAAIDARKKLEEQANKERQDADKDAADKAEKQIEAVKEFSDSLFSLMQDAINLQIQAIDHQEQLQKDAIDRQLKLAEAGRENTLSQEEKRLADMEKLRMKEQKKLQHAKELEVFLNSVAEFSKTDPKTAVAKAVAQMALVKGAEALFAEEGGLVGSGMTKYKGQRHSRKEHIVVAEEGEGILSRKEISAMGGEAAFMDMKKSLSYNFRTKQIPSGVLAVGMNTKNMERRLAQIEEAVKNIPGTNIDVDALGNLIEERIQNGVREVTKHILKKTRLG